VFAVALLTFLSSKLTFLSSKLTFLSSVGLKSVGGRAANAGARDDARGASTAACAEGRIRRMHELGNSGVNRQF